jgi:hypothetical protein
MTRLRDYKKLRKDGSIVKVGDVRELEGIVEHKA